MAMVDSAYQGLVCIHCGKLFQEQTLTQCPSCNGILTGKYDLGSADVSLKKTGSIWQFSSMFPHVSEENVTSLGEGWTPYIKSSEYGKSIGSRNTWLKLEGQNPSGSFKDRVASLEISLLRQWKRKGVFTASSGNAAAAISAYAARGGVKSLLLVREDSTVSKLGQISMYDPVIIRVRNLFSTKQSLTAALGKVQEVLPEWHNGFVWALFNPLALDALKTVAYEIAAVNVPDCIFVPTAGGDLLYGIYKGFEELKQLGLVDRVPRMVAVQGEGADPLVQAIEKGLESVRDIDEANTIAGALRVNFGADHPLVAVKNSNGFGVSVTDEEIIRAQKEIAKKDGVFAEMSSSTAPAAIAKAIREGKIREDEVVTAIITGSGFKDYRPGFSTVESIPLMGSVDELAKKINGLV